MPLTSTRFLKRRLVAGLSSDGSGSYSASSGIQSAKEPL